jgi:hypothetical protein
MNDELWDYVGVAQALKAWSFLTAADNFGDIIFNQAFEPNRTVFKYDDQETVYRGVDSIARLALSFLLRTDGKVNTGNLARGDIAYGGNREKWIRFTYGVLARLYHHQTNKSDYKPDSVLKFVGLALQSAADNFICPHSATKNDDTNVWGPARDNLPARRQSRFIVQLMDGTTFTGNSNPENRDPRMRGMLSVSPDTATLVNNSYSSLNGGYRYLIPATSGVTDPNNASAPTTAGGRRRVSTLYGDSSVINTGVGNWISSLGKYLFQNRVGFPIMTYHEMQFIKAEAAFLKNEKSTAFNAYRLGITEHFAFVNQLNASAPGVVPINPSQRNAYLAGGNVKQSELTLTLTDIMLQKFISDFGWNFIECWMDLRRYHYFDVDPITGNPVYIDFSRGIPFFSSNNLGPKPAQRFFPITVSENDWNIDELRRIGGLNIDYHTYENWVTKP